MSKVLNDSQFSRSNVEEYSVPVEGKKRLNFGGLGRYKYISKDREQAGGLSEKTNFVVKRLVGPQEMVITAVIIF